MDAGGLGVESGSEAMTRYQELLAVALWVKKDHGGNGWFDIHQQQERLLTTGAGTAVTQGSRIWMLNGQSEIDEKVFV